MIRNLTLASIGVCCLVACSDASMDSSNGALSNKHSPDETGEVEGAPASGDLEGEGEPRVVAGNPPSCAAAGAGDLTLFKVDPAKSGTYTSPDGKLTVTITASEKTFSFTSNRALGWVIVKGGPAANVYDFVPPVSDATGLVAPRGAGLSHLNFCYPPDGGGSGGSGGVTGVGGSNTGVGGKGAGVGGKGAGLGGSGTGVGGKGAGVGGGSDGGSGGRRNSGGGSGGAGVGGSGSGGSGPCPPNYQLWLASEGASICTPVPSDRQCPSGYVLDVVSEGQYCIPAPVR